jgi:quercetin dioxygenase-like cupin family protein
VDQPATGRRTNPSDEVIHLGPLAVRFLATSAETNGSLALFELTVPAGAHLAAPPHSHDHYEETIYGLEGMLMWKVDGISIEVRPGEALPIPRGAVHQFDNNSQADARVLCVITPAAIGPEFFRESAEVLNAAAGGPPDRAKLATIMRRYGLRPVLPPHP